MPSVDVIGVREDIRAALADGRPVVALESSVIAHGLPSPANLRIAHSLEEAVRVAGATPATVGVIRGRVRVGLERDEIERLGAAGEIVKCAAGDLGWAITRGADGATTVSATVFAAAAAGIEVVATGGIGGVHRGNTGDVSADLPTLAHHPVAVVAAGAKSILDLPKTLEALETLGVPVVGLGTQDFPAFYARSSGLVLDKHTERVEDIARLCLIRWRRLRQQGGVLVACPCPEEQALVPSEVERATARALSDAAAKGIYGKSLTPWLLTSVTRSLGARTIPANHALLLNNARAGASIAIALCELSSAPTSLTGH
ncbi:MAG TPA: pseudouridine-5'-phosphate glycosidase [Pseudonocardiaceae bacterium]|nr:pseudouridine-5'-phosphate glycosidase [Pseudonocardiaceae bacterium]